MKIEMEVVEKPDFNKMDKAVTTSFNRSTVKLVAKGAKFLRRNVPVKTGHLRNSIRHDKTDIWSVAEHFRYVDEGTRPHRIEGLLVFYIHGIKIVSRGVDHPGSKPQHLINKTLKYIESNVKDVKNDINRVIK